MFLSIVDKHAPFKRKIGNNNICQCNLNVTKAEHMFIGSDHNLDKIRNTPLLYLDKSQ